MKKMSLPSPRSPADLDKKILAYALQKAPTKKPFGFPLWLTGMATASVVAVAVMIALPQQTKQLRATTEAARSFVPTPNLGSDTSPSPAKPRAQMAELRMEVPRKAKKQAAPVAAISADATELFSDLETSERGMAGRENTDNISAVDDLPLQTRLQEIAALQKGGHTQEAVAAYEALQRQCPSCNLPQNLQQALETYNINN